MNLIESHEKYLKYLDTIYKRIESSNQSTGLSVWALSSAIVFIFWKLIPLLTKSAHTLIITESISIYVHLYFSFLMGAFFFSKRNVFSSAYDYTVPAAPEDWKISFLVLPAIYFVPACIGKFALPTDYATYKITGLTFRCMLGLIFLPIVGYLHSLLYLYWTGYQHFNTVNRPRKNGPFPLMVKLGIYSFIIFVLMLNLRGLYKDFNFLPVDEAQSESAITLGFDCFVINALFCFLLPKLLPSNTTLSIASLERDIVLYNLTDEEIKKRISQDVLAFFPFSMWISEKVRLLSESGDQLMNAIEEISKTRAQIETIPIEYTAEIISRVEKYQKRFAADFEDYNKNMRRMLGWLEGAINQISLDRDKYIIKVIKETISSLQNQSSTITKKCNEELDGIRETLKKTRLHVQKRH